MPAFAAEGAPRHPAAKEAAPTGRLRSSHAASQAGELAGLKTNRSPSISFQLERVPSLAGHRAGRGRRDAGRWWDYVSREGGRAA